MVKGKKKHRTLFVAVSISFSVIFLFVALIYIWLNLGKYSVYYAQHLPHKVGTNPVMVAVFNNLDAIYIPNANYDVPFGGVRVKTSEGDIDYRFEGLKNNDISVFKKGELSFSLKPEAGGLDLIDFVTPYTYNFNSKGEFISVTYSEETTPKTIKPTLQYIIIVKEKLNEMYGFIVSHRQAPKINLQWIYNLFNYWRFNS
ncbi:hypothetical protein LMG9449_0727 [Lactococcus lactis subsp. lactis]|uniref:Uncharacterized protein n=2 Tax=Lactococcus lactis TaxID=1358 RepID=A0A0V8E1K5_LACLL|nr:hypothetical protein LMG9449_0727 [Lactococcus lactis subsp. lactis]